MFKAKALPNAPPAWLRRKIPLLVNSVRSGVAPSRTEKVDGFHLFYLPGKQPAPRPQ